MTPEDAIADLVAIRDAIPSAQRAGRRAAGEAAVEQIKSVWPIGPGSGPHSIDGWAYDDDRGVHNDIPHTPFVHDGLAARLVPATLLEMEHIHDEIVTAALLAAGGR